MDPNRAISLIQTTIRNYIKHHSDRVKKIVASRQKWKTENQKRFCRGEVNYPDPYVRIEGDLVIPTLKFDDDKTKLMGAGVFKEDIATSSFDYSNFSKEFLENTLGFVNYSNAATLIDVEWAHPTPLPDGGSLEIHRAYHHLQDRALQSGNQDFQVLHMHLRHVIEVYFDDSDEGHRCFLRNQFSHFAWDLKSRGWKVSPAVAAICSYAVVRSFLLALDDAKVDSRDHTPAVGLVARKTTKPRPTPAWQRPWQLDTAGTLFLTPKVEAAYERALVSSWDTNDTKWIPKQWTNVRGKFPSAAEKARVREKKEVLRRWMVHMMEKHAMSPRSGAGPDTTHTMTVDPAVAALTRRIMNNVMVQNTPLSDPRPYNEAAAAARLARKTKMWAKRGPARRRFGPMTKRASSRAAYSNMACEMLPRGALIYRQKLGRCSKDIPLPPYVRRPRAPRAPRIGPATKLSSIRTLYRNMSCMELPKAAYLYRVKKGGCPAGRTF
eukprot:jgi/Mesvir1/16167/Mv08434-RA.1